MKYRYDAYVLYGSKFKPILARKVMIDELTSKLKSKGFVVKRYGINAGDRLKYKKWVYY